MYTTEIYSVLPKIFVTQKISYLLIRKYKIFLMLKYTFSMLLLAVRRSHLLVLNNAFILQNLKVLSSMTLL